MDMTYTPEQVAFRREVRSWIQQALPPHIKRKAEGAVFKRLDGKYAPGRPASGGSQVKLKFFQ